MRKYWIAFILAVFILVSLTPGLGASEQGADQVGQDSLTLDETVKLALDNNNELRKSDLDVEAALITRDEVWDAYNVFLKSTYIPGTDLHVSVPTDDDPQGLVYQSNYAWLAKQKAYEVQAETVVLTAQKKYINVIMDINDLKAKKLAEERDNEKYRIDRLKHQLGMITQLELSSTQTQAQASAADRITAEQNLDKAYEELADYIGLSDDDRLVLEDSIAYSPLKIDNIEVEINSIVDNSPSVWLANEGVRLEEQTYGLESWDLDKADLKSAKAGVDVAEDSMREYARKLYYQVKQLEESYEAAELGVNAAEQGVANAKLSYEVGMATRADVLTAEAALEKARGDSQLGLKTLIYQHYLLKQAFLKPWIASVLS